MLLDKMDQSTKAEIKGLAKTYLRVIAIIILAGIGTLFYTASDEGAGSWAAIIFLGAALYLYFRPHLQRRKAKAAAAAEAEATGQPAGDA